MCNLTKDKIQRLIDHYATQTGEYKPNHKWLDGYLVAMNDVKLLMD